MSRSLFWIVSAVILALGFYATQAGLNEYYFVAGYVVLQFVIMATAWNILGGFTGYVNFGSAAFFAAGAYTTIALNKYFVDHQWFEDPPMILFIVAGGLVSGLIGLGAGYLTLRLKGVYFAIATLAMAIVLETLIVNWEYVGGARGAFIMFPEKIAVFGIYPAYLFFLILVLAVGSVAVARYIHSSRIGRGLAAIRDDELAAECMGVPTLRLKLISTTVMGVIMGVAGAPYPFFVSYVDPASAFSLLIAVNSIAMPMIGGTASWIGPVIGALLLGTAQEIMKVTSSVNLYFTTIDIPSEINLLIVGVILVAFVTLAPQGIVGLYHAAMRRKGKG